MIDENNFVRPNILYNVCLREISMENNQNSLVPRLTPPKLKAVCFNGATLLFTLHLKILGS